MDEAIIILIAYINEVLCLSQMTMAKSLNLPASIFSCVYLRHGSSIQSNKTILFSSSISNEVFCYFHFDRNEAAAFQATNMSLLFDPILMFKPNN